MAQAGGAAGAAIAESTISQVLAGKRKLNRGQIGKLARYFHVEPAAFVLESGPCTWHMAERRNGV